MAPSGYPTSFKASVELGVADFQFAFSISANLQVPEVFVRDGKYDGVRLSVYIQQNFRNDAEWEMITQLKAF